MKKKSSKLLFRMVIGFVILGLTISVSSTLVGSLQYRNSARKQYNDFAYKAADIAESYLDKKLLAEYVDAAVAFNNGEIDETEINTIIASQEYQNTYEKLLELRRDIQANDVFVICMDTEEIARYDSSWTTDDLADWYPLTYIFDSYVDESLSFPLGTKGHFNPKYIADASKIWTTGEKVDNYFISLGEYGYNTSAMLPISDSDGVIAILVVEIPMLTIQSNLQKFVGASILAITIAVLVVIGIYMIYFFKSVIKPINRVAVAANDFIKNDKKLSGNLLKIKTKDEIENLARSVYKMEEDINDYIDNITTITAEKERIGAELDVARNIQASMLPCIFPAFPDRKELDIYATMSPAKEVGGDFYDFFMIDDRHIAIVMADVSGKGIPAALFMVIGKTLIKDHTQLGSDLGEVFTEVNNLLCESNSEGLFITAFEGVLDLVTGEFTFVNAGHEMPFIYRKAEDKYEAYKIKPGFVLAGMEDMKYKSGSLQLEVGDKIFQYTDGVTEATDLNNNLYGMERLGAVLNKCTGSAPEETLNAVKKDIDKFVGSAPQFDDITMLCLEYKERQEQ